MLPISLVLSPDPPAGPVRVMAAGVLIHRWELILALPATWATPWLGTRRGEERGREDGLTLIPPAVYTCGSWQWFKASLLALTLQVLVGSPVTQEVVPPLEPLVLPPTPQNWPKAMDSVVLIHWPI